MKHRRFLGTHQDEEFRVVKKILLEKFNLVDLLLEFRKAIAWGFEMGSLDIIFGDRTAASQFLKILDYGKTKTSGALIDSFIDSIAIVQRIDFSELAADFEDHTLIGWNVRVCTAESTLEENGLGLQDVEIGRTELYGRVKKTKELTDIVEAQLEEILAGFLSDSFIKEKDPDPEPEIPGDIEYPNFYYTISKQVNTCSVHAPQKLNKKAPGKIRGNPTMVCKACVCTDCNKYDVKAELRNNGKSDYILVLGRWMNPETETLQKLCISCNADLFGYEKQGNELVLKG